MLEMLEQKLPEEKTSELLLPKGEDVVVANSLLFKKTLRFEDYSFRHHYTLTTQIKIKPLAFLGRYASTFVTAGLFSRKNLEDRFGLYVSKEGPFYLRLSPSLINFT